MHFLLIDKKYFKGNLSYGLEEKKGFLSTKGAKTFDNQKSKILK